MLELQIRMMHVLVILMLM